MKESRNNILIAIFVLSAFVFFAGFFVFVKVLSDNAQDSRVQIGVSTEKVENNFWGDTDKDESVNKNTSTNTSTTSLDVLRTQQEVNNESEEERLVGVVSSAQDVAGEVNNSITKELTSAQANIKITLLPGWKKIPLSQVISPIYNENVFLALQNESDNCSVAFVKNLPHYNTAKEHPMQQVSFFKTESRLFANSGRWAVLKRDHPEITKFLYKRTPMRGEFVDIHFVPLASNAYDIILYSTDRSIVSDKCANDFREMLFGAELYIPKYTKEELL